MRVSSLLFTTFCSIVLLAPSEGWIQQQQIKRLSNIRLGAASSSTTAPAINNNIVLKPTTNDPAAFDSHMIGNARVHRYSRENDPDSETEYVMWYHGRTREMADDPTLPPLSTGRIGRAVSRNGLHWEKISEGSASEDAPDVSLGLNKDSWWSFDTAHVGLGNVLLPMTSPAVLTEGGVYIMYFMGGSLEETPIADYMSKDLPESMKDAKIAGMKMKIGVALSQDGITWGRIEGDDPTGACMVPFDPSDPNQASTGISPDVEEELYCAWPEVAVNFDGEKSSAFLMYYSTMTAKDKQKCIAYAESPDGFRWVKKGICLRPDDGAGPDAGGCARCCVLQDATYDESLGTWKQAKTWTMYYEGVSPEDGKHRVMVATSKDRRNWTKKGVVLDVGAGTDAWDNGGVGSPHVLRMDDGSMRMYYTGQGSDGSTAVGVAKLQRCDDSVGWIREQATFTFVE